MDEWDLRGEEEGGMEKSSEEQDTGRNSLALPLVRVR